MKISKLTFACLIWLGATLLLASCNADAGKPNVIIILTDDQGYGDFSLHGNPALKTPNLDQLATESIRLTDFHVAPICSPTRSQILTGQDAARNGAFAWAYSREIIHPDVPVMPEIFAANGYRTGHFGKWHLGDNYPFRPQDRGFEETIHHGGAAITQTPDYWENDYFDDYFSHNGQIEQYQGYCTDVWFREAMRWMKARKDEGQPFFVYLPTNAPHGPLYVDPSYAEPYGEQQPAVARFFGMIANIDDNVATLERFLVEEDLRANTILVFMTDNGGTAGVRVYNAGMRGRKGSLYDGGHRVPLFIRWPAGGLRPAGEIDVLATAQDLLPTLIDLCELQQPAAAAFDGVSLTPLLRGASDALPDRMVVVQHATAPEMRQGAGAVLWNKWRLVEGNELYDVGSDPGQETDLAARHPEVAERMREHYESWWRGVQSSIENKPHIILGSPNTGAVRLACFDWHGHSGEDNVTLQRTVRAGAAVNGYWNVEVERAGLYEIALRRWPEEAGTPIRSGLPEYKARVATFPAGKALPVRKARLAVGEYAGSVDVGPDDEAAVFEVRLAPGKMRLQTWFYDQAGNELCGAYHVRVDYAGAQAFE